MSQAMLKVAIDIEFRKKTICKCKEKVLREFSWFKRGKQIQEIYKTVLV